MNFHKDELVWRDDKYQHDEMMTRMTAVEDNMEFERQIFLMRIARAFGGIGKGGLRNRQSRHLADVLQKVLVRIMFALLLSIDGIISLLKKIVKHREKGTFKCEGVNSCND